MTSRFAVVAADVVDILAGQQLVKVDRRGLEGQELRMEVAEGRRL